MKDRDYLWCVLNLMLDDEDTLQRLCPACRLEAEKERCPVCGVEHRFPAAGVNEQFDIAHYERLQRGENA